MPVDQPVLERGDRLQCRRIEAKDEAKVENDGARGRAVFELHAHLLGDVFDRAKEEETLQVDGLSNGAGQYRKEETQELKRKHKFGRNIQSM